MARRRGGGPVVWILAAAALAPGPGVSGQTSPERPRPMEAASLMADVVVLAHDSLQGRAAGGPGAALARRHLTARLAGMGYRVAADTFPVRRRGGETMTGVNLRVAVPGTTFPDRWMVLTAHYDHVGVRDGEIYNGADDNASGTAALLALAAELRESRLHHGVLLAFLDAEEGGLQGARHLVAEAPVPLDHVLVNVNLDMVGHSDGELWVVGTTPYPALRPLVQAVEPVPPVFLVFGHDTATDTGADSWVGASDHAAFHARGIPFLYFGVADHPDYHRPTDDAETLNPAFLEGAARTVLRVVLHLDRSLAGTRPGS